MTDWSALDAWGAATGGINLPALLSADADAEARTIRAALSQSRRTPDAWLPDTAIGRAYLRMPEIARLIANAYAKAIETVDYRDAFGVDNKQAAIDTLARLIDQFILDFSFEEFSADPRGVLQRAASAPLFTWDESIPLARIRFDPFGEIPFPMQQVGARFRMPPAFGAYHVLAMVQGFGNYLLPVLPQDVAPFRGYGTSFTYDRQNGFTFTSIPSASEWFSAYSNVTALAPPHHWPIIWRDYWHRIENQRARYNDAAERQRFITWVISTVALVGFTNALVQVMQNGITMANGVKLVAAADRLPGVDLGDATPFISAASRVLSLDLFSGLSDAAEPVTVAADATQSTAAESANMDIFGVDTTQIVGDFDGVNFGGIADGGFGSIGYIDPSFIDFAGDIDLSMFDFAGAGTGGYDPLAGLTTPGNEFISFDSQLDALANTAGNLDLTQLITSLASTYLNYRLADRALEMRGAPSSVRSAAMPTPGSVRTLPDGTTLRTNPDGSTTVRQPNGNTRTVTPDGRVIAPGMSSMSGAGSTMFPGVSNQTLLVAGVSVAAVAVLLLAKKGTK